MSAVLGRCTCQRGESQQAGADDDWGDLPEYIERDHDEELRRRLRAAAVTGGFLVVVGDSSVGKTRSLYEAVRALLPNWRILLPDDATAVRHAAQTLPPRTVVWLDDTPAERYFTETGHGGLSRTDLLRLTDRDDRTGPIVVLDLLWPNRYRALTRSPAGRPAEDDRWRDGREALALAGEPVEVADQFSQAERNRAAAPAATDPRLADALADTQFGVTQVLAGAPELVARWRRADPYANAVITAAIDASRLGIRTPLTTDLLEAAATGYLTDRQRAEAPTGWFRAALGYSTEHGKGTTAPLLPHPGATVGEINGYTVADYLLQHLTRQRRCTRLSAVTWQALIDHTHDDHDLARLALHADRRLLYRYAEPLYRHFAGAGDTYAAHRLADLLVKRNGPAEEITAAFQFLIEGGRSYDENIWVDGTTCQLVVRQLDEQGRNDVAATVLRAWADAGNRAAAADWAKTLVEQDRIEQASLISRTVVAIGQEHIVESWFERLLTQDKIDQAMIVLRAFIDAGGIRTSSGDSLDDWLQGWAYPGDTSGKGWFDRLAKQGRGGDAMTILRAVADAGGSWSAQKLAERLAEQGNIDELRARADAVERERRGRRDDWFGERLADLLAEQGNIEELRARADNGSWRAADQLAYLLVHTGDIEGLRARADAGDEAAGKRLADLLAGQGDIEELRDRAGNGDKYAARRLADLLAEQGHLDEAITIVRALALTGLRPSPPSHDVVAG